jgi:hypothetical protein
MLERIGIAHISPSSQIQAYDFQNSSFHEGKPWRNGHLTNGFLSGSARQIANFIQIGFNWQELL